jgi:hypothetical protein
MHLAKTLHVSVDALLVGVDKQYDLWRDPRTDLIADHAALAMRAAELHETVVQMQRELAEMTAALEARIAQLDQDLRRRQVRLIAQKTGGGGGVNG